MKASLEKVIGTWPWPLQNYWVTCSFHQLPRLSGQLLAKKNRAARFAPHLPLHFFPNALDTTPFFYQLRHTLGSPSTLGNISRNLI
jgi:hypothetical protein